MTCPFPYYNEIKSKLCIYYLGHSKEYLVLLRLLRPTVEKEFDLDIYICCRDEYVCWLDGSKIIPLSQFENKKKEFVHAMEITYASDEIHPISRLTKDITFKKIEQGKPKTQIGIIIEEGNFPTKPLTPKQTSKLKEWLIIKGMKPIIANDINLIETAGIVAGVESEFLFQAAALGIPTALVPTGIGTELYQYLFSPGLVISL